MLWRVSWAIAQISCIYWVNRVLKTETVVHFWSEPVSGTFTLIYSVHIQLIARSVCLNLAITDEKVLLNCLLMLCCCTLWLITVSYIQCIVQWISALSLCWSMQRRFCSATMSSSASRRIVPTKVSQSHLHLTPVFLLIDKQTSRLCDVCYFSVYSCFAPCMWSIEWSWDTKLYSRS